MYVVCDGEAKIKHKTTGVVYTIGAADLIWLPQDLNRHGTPEIMYSAMVEHPDLGVLIWALYEYPKNVEHSKETDCGPHELVADIDYQLVASKEDRN